MGRPSRPLTAWRTHQPTPHPLPLSSGLVVSVSGSRWLGMCCINLSRHIHVLSSIAPRAPLAHQVKPGTAAISLTKGMRVRPDGPQLISAMVRRYLGIECCVLMGANIATVGGGGDVGWG